MIELAGLCSWRAAKHNPWVVVNVVNKLAHAGSATLFLHSQTCSQGSIQHENILNSLSATIFAGAQSLQLFEIMSSLPTNVQLSLTRQPLLLDAYMSSYVLAVIAVNPRFFSRKYYSRARLWLDDYTICASLAVDGGRSR